LIAHIGELLPAGKLGAGRGNKNSKGGLPFSKPTLSAYRKVATHKKKIDQYFPAYKSWSRVATSDRSPQRRHGRPSSWPPIQT
jgi:hypothetical protein